MNVGTFWGAVNACCLACGGSVTSGVRSMQRNAAVNGVSTSFHLVGMAADVVLDDDADGERFTALCERLGLRVIPEGDHYHIQPRE